jgi:uncharacterized protein
MVQLFFDREQELQFLEKHYETQTAELIVLYGRRRVGKSELTLNFSKNKPHIYFLADRRPETQLIQELKHEMSRYLQDESFEKLALTDWAELFVEFTKWNKNQQAVVIIDEFPVLIETNRAIPSIFQKIWDQNLKNTHIMLILLGSSIAMMETEVLNHKSPLYGRRTAQWKLQPLKLTDTKPFYPKYDLETLVQVYGCLGGVPAYLLKFSDQAEFWENVEQKILSKGEFLYQEADFLLREELREPRNYAAILQAIALGASTYGEIVNQTGLERSMLSKYLSILEDLSFVRRVYPVAAKVKPRKGQYGIADNYLNFWFKYIFPNRIDLEAGNTKYVLNKIRKDYNDYLGHVFEQMVLDLLKEVQKKSSLPFAFSEIGKWWYKDTEIDIVATDDQTKTATFIETKWSIIGGWDSQRILTNLKQKAKQFRWNREKENYGIIAKQIDDKQQLRDQGYVALDLEDFK